MTAERVILAVDGGGTGSRAAVGTVSQGVIGVGEIRKPGNVHSDFKGAITHLMQAVDAALANAGLSETPPDELTAHFGVAGAHSETEMRAVADALPFSDVCVTGDRATMVRGALGTADGFVVALGTGTIVARQTGLVMKTVGGWGLDLSDHASGAWLGRRLLEEALLAEDGLRPHTDLSRAALATHGGLIKAVHFAAHAAPVDYAPHGREVIEAAASGDALGQSLLKEGVRYIDNALNTLGFEEGDALVLAGGVGPHYAELLPAYLTANVQPAKGSALDGAFAMASDAAKKR